MSKFPMLDEARRERLLTAPSSGRLRVVLDTDTYNEIDDQFAVVHALLSPERLDLQAIYAAPFWNDRSTGPGDGMEKSYEEIIRLLERMNRDPDGFAFRGSDRVLGADRAPVSSAAAEDLVRRAMASDGESPLYVATIGAITNVASALLMEPGIVDRIVVVWLGGQPPHWPSAKEFNLSGDLIASQLVFDSGVPLVQIPCETVASHLVTTVPEVERYVEPQGAIGAFLAQRFKEYSSDHFGWAKEIWDISATGYLINPGWVATDLVPSPILTDESTWEHDPARHKVRIVRRLRRNPFFRDLFAKLKKHAEGAS